MSRSGVFYVVKAMERSVAGTDAPRVPARQAVDREAAAARPEGGTSLVRRMLAAVRHGIGTTSGTGAAPGTAGRGRRRLSGAARAD